MPFTQSSLSLPTSQLQSGLRARVLWSTLPSDVHTPMGTVLEPQQVVSHTPFEGKVRTAWGVTGSPDLGKVTQWQPEGIRNPRTDTHVSSQAWRQWAVEVHHLGALTQGRDCQKPLASGQESDQCKEQCPVSDVLSPGGGRFLRRGDSSTHEVKSPRCTGLWWQRWWDHKWWEQVPEVPCSSSLTHLKPTWLDRHWPSHPLYSEGGPAELTDFPQVLLVGRPQRRASQSTQLQWLPSWTDQGLGLPRHTAEDTEERVN